MHRCEVVFLDVAPSTCGELPHPLLEMMNCWVVNGIEKIFHRDTDIP